MVDHYDELLYVLMYGIPCINVYSKWYTNGYMWIQIGTIGSMYGIFNYKYVDEPGLKKNSISLYNLNLWAIKGDDFPDKPWFHGLPSGKRLYT